MKLAVDGQRRRWLRDHDIGTKARWLRDAMMGFEAYADRTAARLLWGETQKELIYVAGAEVYTHLLTGGRCPPLTAEHLDDVYHPLLIFGKNILSADQLRIAIGCFANYAGTEPGVPGGSFARPFRTPSRLLLICSQFRTACNANPLTHAVLNGIKKGVILPLLAVVEHWSLFCVLCVKLWVFLRSISLEEMSTSRCAATSNSGGAGFSLYHEYRHLLGWAKTICLRFQQSLAN